MINIFKYDAAHYWTVRWVLFKTWSKELHNVNKDTGGGIDLNALNDAMYLVSTKLS